MARRTSSRWDSTEPPPGEVIDFNEDELWAIHDRVRRHDESGQEWDRDTATQMMAALLAVHDSAGNQSTAPVLLEEGDLWQIDRQIPSTQRIGKAEAKTHLLLATAQAIVRLRGGEDHEQQYIDSRQDAGSVAARGASSALAS